MATPSKKSSDPFWWALFGAGGALAALCIPVLLFLNGLAVPLGLVEAPAYEEALALARHPLARLFLFVLISLSMFHWAHRFRFTLYDGLQLKHLEALIVVFCYGGAFVVTVFAAIVLIRL
jgi:fumarate reductase subunit D